MFPNRYFPERYFPDRYWPQGGAVVPPIPPVTGQAHGGIVDSETFAEWLAQRPTMSWPDERERIPIEEIELFQENQRRIVLLMLAEDDYP